MDPLDTTPAAAGLIEQRWGAGVNAGFVAVPVLLLRHQKALGISDGAMVVLMNILAAWWYEKKLPFPSSHTIAERMGVTLRTVQRHLGELERNGLLQRLRDTPNAELTDIVVTKYSPAGLVAKLKKLGEDLHPRSRKALQPEKASAEGVTA